MLKLSLTILLLSSSLFAFSDLDLEEFLENKFNNNPRIVKLEVNVVGKTLVKELENKNVKNPWYAYVVKIKADVKSNPKNLKQTEQMTQKMIWFSNGTMVTPEFFDIDIGDSIKDNYQLFDESYYRDENHIYGDKNAKHKVAIFSDPLCPFCRKFVPKAIEDMKKYPKQFAIYYYHFPLPRLHPASVALTKAAIVAQEQGEKNIILKLYNVKVDAHEKDVKKILKAFNKTMGTNIKPSDIATKKVKEQYGFDQKVAEDAMVAGTPTIFFDGKLDKSKKKYKEVK